MIIMKKTQILLLLSAIGILTLSGCSSSKYKKTDASEENVASFVDNNMYSLINNIDKSLQELHRREKGAEPKTDVLTPIGTTTASRYIKPGIEAYKPLSDQPDGITKISQDVIAKNLDRVVTLNWNGDINDLLNNLAKKADFSFIRTQSPTGKVIVKVRSQKESIKTVLGKVADQVNEKTDILVDVKTKTISVRYK